MKYAVIVLILAAPLFLFGDQPYVPTENEELYGTWINEEYTAHQMSSPSRPLGGTQELVCLPDGNVEARYIFRGSKLVRSFSCSISTKWSDSSGDIYYKQTWIKYFEYGGKRLEEFKSYSLSKISNSGSNIEIVFNAADYPDQIDTSHESYQIYYR